MWFWPKLFSHPLSWMVIKITTGYFPHHDTVTFFSWSSAVSLAAVHREQSLSSHCLKICTCNRSCMPNVRTSQMNQMLCSMVKWQPAPGTKTYGSGYQTPWSAYLTLLGSPSLPLPGCYLWQHVSKTGAGPSLNLKRLSSHRSQRATGPQGERPQTTLQNSGRWGCGGREAAQPKLLMAKTTDTFTFAVTTGNVVTSGDSGRCCPSQAIATIPKEAAEQECVFRNVLTWLSWCSKTLPRSRSL